MVTYRYLYIFFCIPLPLIQKVGFPVSTSQLGWTGCWW